MERGRRRHDRRCGAGVAAPVGGRLMLLVVLATFGAGFLNSVAGGGSLISFPALVASGLPPLTANVTNTLALWPGYVGGAATHVRKLRRGDGRLRRDAAAAGVGAVGGAAALLLVDDDVFDMIVPFLVLFAAGLLAVPERWLARLPRPRPAGAAGAVGAAGAGSGGTAAVVGAAVEAGRDRRRGVRGWVVRAALALCGAYGAFFGGALGVVLLAFLTVFEGDDLPQANAVKNTLSLLVNTVALGVFVGLAPVDWPSVAVGGPASLAGALVGAVAFARIDVTWLRGGIVAYAFVAGMVLLVT